MSQMPKPAKAMKPRYSEKCFYCILDFNFLWKSKLFRNLKKKQYKMIFQNTLDETTKIGYNRMTNQWDVGLLKKSEQYVPPEAKAREGDEPKVF